MKIEIKKYNNLIRRYLSNQLLWILLLWILMFGSMGLQLYIPQILRNVIDGIIGDTSVKQIINWLIFFLILILFGKIVKILISYIGGKVGWYATNRLRRDLLRHCLEQTEESLQNFKSGELLEIIDGDVDVLTNFFSTLLILAGQAVLLVIGTLIAIYFENIWIGGAETIFVIFVFFFSTIKV